MNPSGGRPNSDNPSDPPESQSGWRFGFPATFGLAGGIDAVTAALKKNPLGKSANPLVSPPDLPADRSNLDTPSDRPASWSSWTYWKQVPPVTLGLVASSQKTSESANPNPDIPSGPPEGQPGWKSWVKELPLKIGLATAGNAVAGAPIAKPPGDSVISSNDDERPNSAITSGPTEGQLGWKSWVKELPAKIGLPTAGNALAGASVANPPGESMISPFDDGGPNSDIPPDSPEGQSSWKTLEKGLPAALGLTAAGVAVAGVPLIIAGAGFGTGGIAAGSVAAKIMSGAATAGVGMGAVSALQSAGVVGLAAGTKILIGATTGAAAAKIAGVALDKGNPQGGNPSGGHSEGNNMGGNVVGEGSRDNESGENGGGEGSRGNASGENGGGGGDGSRGNESGENGGEDGSRGNESGENGGEDGSRGKDSVENGGGGDGSRGNESGENGAGGEDSWYSGREKYLRSKI